MLHVMMSPQYRYQHAKIIHAVRVALAMLASILATIAIHMPVQSSVWASVTTMIVICGLQHHGKIRRKAFERGLGTLLGSLIGLTLIVVRTTSGSDPLVYLLMSIVAGVCGYYAVGRGGYIALLTTITMCIVAGHGENELITGLWRTGGVVVGIVIALAFSFALPLYATYSWRYGLADDLRACARLYQRVVNGEHIDSNTFARQFISLGGQFVRFRDLMPSVQKEIGISLTQLKQMQRLHRSLLSSIEILSEGIGQAGQDVMRQAFSLQGKAQGNAVCAMLFSTARALRFGGDMTTLMKDDDHPAAAPMAHDIPDDMVISEGSGPAWLAQRLARQVTQLRELLRETQSSWNIEGRHFAGQ